MGHRGVGVVQVREHDDPVVREDVRDEVVLDERGERSVVRPDGKEGRPRGEADVRDDDGDAVGSAEEGRGGKPMLWNVEFVND